MYEPTSSDELHNAILSFNNNKKGANFFHDRKLKRTTNIETVFNNRGHCIMFNGSDGHVGHWYVLLRDFNKNVFIVDSFGENPEKYCDNLVPFLKNNGIKKIIINKTKFQDNKSAVCGRYAVAMIAMRKLGYSIDDIYKIMEEGKKKFKTYDNFILNIST